MRETKTLYGQSRIGFLWAVLEPLVVLAPLYVIFFVMDMERRLPFGMNLWTFLLTAEGAFIIFSTTITKMLPSVKGNKALLAYPQVSPLDLMIARGILNGAVKIGVFGLLTCGLYTFGLIIEIHSPMRMICSLLIIWFLGLGVGMILASIAVVRHSIEQLTGSALRLLFFASGTFFNLDMISVTARSYLLRNPIFHLIEIIRSSFGQVPPHSDISLLYPASLVPIFLFIGLVSERVIRTRIEKI